MSSASIWTAATESLWQRVVAHPFPGDDKRCDFAAKLALSQGWNRAHAMAAIEEYRRFCFLAAISNTPMCPSHEVDAVWHLHLTHTRDYWLSWCPQVLQATLHHDPNRQGTAGLTAERANYAETLARYEEYFGPASPVWWPGTAERFSTPGRFREVDVERAWIVPKPLFSWRVTTLSARIALLASLSISATAFAGTPLDWDGPSFIKLFLTLMPIVAVTSLIWRYRLRNTGAAAISSMRAPLEVACLADGQGRCLDTTIADLMRQNIIAFDVGTQWFSVVQRETELPAAQAAVRNLIAADGRFEQVVKRGAQLFGDVSLKLQRSGLLLDDAAARRVAWAPALPPILLMLFGVAKIVIGFSIDRPVSFLVLLVLVMLAFCAWLVLRPPRLTIAGDRMLSDLRRMHARNARAPRDSELPLAVAMIGTVAMSGTAWGSYHDLRAPPTSNSTSSSNSDSGGDSGGSDGGGGCGGCGGGGD